MTNLPPDVEATLGQLLDEAGDAARERQTDDVRATLRTLERMAREEIPDGQFNERFRHGIAEVEALVADEPLVAAAYLDAMRRLLRSATE